MVTIVHIVLIPKNIFKNSQTYAFNIGRYYEIQLSTGWSRIIGTETRGCLEALAGMYKKFVL